jgi:hypothetical protein
MSLEYKNKMLIEEIEKLNIIQVLNYGLEYENTILKNSINKLPEKLKSKCLVNYNIKVYNKGLEIENQLLKKEVQLLKDEINNLINHHKDIKNKFNLITEFIKKN